MVHVPSSCLPQELAAFAKRNTASQIYRSLSSGQLLSISDTMKGWWRLVEEYAPLALTKPSDRLPALSGIVAQLDKTLLGHYYAGLWERCLPFWLCWKIESPVRIKPHISYPSWSWCGVQGVLAPGRIQFISNSISGTDPNNTLPQEPKISIISVDCKPDGPNPYGHVSAGTIVLQGMVLRATSLYKANSNTTIDSLYFSNNLWGISWDHDNETMLELGYPSPAYCLQVFEDAWIVLQSMDAERHIYRRRGYIHFCNFDNFWNKERLIMRTSDEASHPNGPFLDEECTLRTITLI
jgi:hypothetical protein